MGRCPSCGALRSEKALCTRCAADLTVLLQVEKAAFDCVQRCYAALALGDGATAQRAALRAFNLQRNAMTREALALAQSSSQTR